MKDKGQSPGAIFYLKLGADNKYRFCKLYRKYLSKTSMEAMTTSVGTQCEWGYSLQSFDIPTG